MDYQIIQEAALDNTNILDEDTRAHYFCTPKDGRKKNKAVSSPGNFCIAFPMKSNIGENRLCYRIWYTEEFKEKRFDEIAEHVSRYIKHCHLPYFIDYTFLRKAIKAGGKELPGVKMEWIDGMKLDEYIKKHKDRNSLLKLADKFMEMCKQFKEAGIAHGDLSNSNMLILPNGEIRLIDYDSVYVPSMTDKYFQTTSGQSAFQHHQRENLSLKSSPNDDNFSQQIIYLSLLVLANNPTFVERISDKELLFTSIELKSVGNFKNKTYDEIKRLNVPEISARLEELATAISGPISEVRSIVDFEMSEASKFIMANYCGICGHHFNNQTDLFCPDCGNKRVTL